MLRHIMVRPRTIRTTVTLGFGLCLLVASGCGSSDKTPASSGTGGAAGNGSDYPDVAIPDVANAQIGAQVFDENQVQTYYLNFTDAELAKLMDMSTLLKDQYTVNGDRYVQASLKIGDTELPSIGVRFKGNYSIWGCVDFGTKKQIQRVEPFFGDIDVCQRFSLKLDFNHYVDRFRLDGLKQLNLHAMAADPSKMRERLAYSLFREMDIPTSRAVHARVYINGVYQGLWAAVEEIDGRFAANRFAAMGNGNLYKQLWPEQRATTSSASAALATNNDPGVADVSDFIAFRDAVVGSTEANFAAKLAPFVDFDYLARYIVVDRAIANYDGIMAFYFGSGWGPFNQNYYWYDAGGQFTLIPRDFDKTLWYPEPNFWSDNSPNGISIVPNWNVRTKSCNGYTDNFDLTIVYNGVRTTNKVNLREIDCDPFLRLLRNEVYDRQKAIADAFIAGPFSQQSVAAKLDAWRAQIADAIAEDPLVDATHWQESVDALYANLPHFQSNLSLMMSGLIDE